MRVAQTHATLLVGATDTTASAADAMVDDLLAGNRTYLRTVAAEKGTITIEQIRELIAFFRLKVPGKAAIRRAAIIRSAETMGHEAQNALLKLLEEPPADSVLILTTGQPRLLLPTILSRVQTRQLQSTEVAPKSEAVQLVRQVLAGTTYDRLLLVDSVLKPKEVALAFVDTLATVARASLEAAAQKGNPIERWRTVLQAAATAQEAFEHSGNPKLVLTELMLAL